MKIHLEGHAAWLIGALQTMGRDFDVELLERPYGGMIAIVVWLYAKANAIALRFGIHLGAKARKPRSAILGAAKKRAPWKATCGCQDEPPARSADAIRKMVAKPWRTTQSVQALQVSRQRPAPIRARACDIAPPRACG